MVGRLNHIYQISFVFASDKTALSILRLDVRCRGAISDELQNTEKESYRAINLFKINLLLFEQVHFAIDR